MNLNKEALRRLSWMKDRLFENGAIEESTNEKVIEFALRYIDKNYSW